MIGKVTPVDRPPSLHTDLPWWRQWYLPLVAVFSLAAALRLWGIDAEPLWLDETASHAFAGQNYYALWFEIPAYEPHPPLYYSLLRFWMQLFGDSEAALRGLSVLFSLATLPLLYAMGQLLLSGESGRFAGFTAALIFAVSPLHLQYAQEARPYALLTFCAALCLLGLVGLLRCAEKADDSPRRRWDAMFGTGLCGLLYSHNLGVLVLPVIGLIWLALVANTRGRPHARHLPWRILIASTLAVVFWLPQAWWLIVQTQRVAADFWISAPDLGRVERVARTLFGINHLWRFDLLWVLPPLAIAGLVLLMRRQRLLSAGALLAFILLPPLLSLLVSWLVRPVFLDRTLIWVTVAYYPLLGVGLCWLPRRWLGHLALVALVIVSTKASYNYFQDRQKEPWDEIVTATLGDGNTPVVIFPNYIHRPFVYYGERLGISAEERATRLIQLPKIRSLTITSNMSRASLPEPLSAAVDNTLNRLHGECRYWIVRRGGHRYDPDDRLLEILTGDGSVGPPRQWHRHNIESFLVTHDHPDCQRSSTNSGSN